MEAKRRTPVPERNSCPGMRSRCLEGKARKQSASDLLEACEGLLHCMELAGWEGDFNADRARAAIAKATGAA